MAVNYQTPSLSDLDSVFELLSDIPGAIGNSTYEWVGENMLYTFGDSVTPVDLARRYARRSVGGGTILTKYITENPSTLLDADLNKLFASKGSVATEPPAILYHTIGGTSSIRVNIGYSVDESWSVQNADTVYLSESVDGGAFGAESVVASGDTISRVYDSPGVRVFRIRAVNFFGSSEVDVTMQIGQVGYSAYKTGLIRSGLGHNQHSVPNYYFCNNEVILANSYTWGTVSQGTQSITHTPTGGSSRVANDVDNTRFRQTGWVGFTGGDDKDVGHVCRYRIYGNTPIRWYSRWHGAFTAYGTSYYPLLARNDYIQRISSTQFIVNGVVKYITLGGSVSGNTFGTRPNYSSGELDPGNGSIRYMSTIFNFTPDIFEIRFIGYGSDWQGSMQVDMYGDTFIERA